MSRSALAGLRERVDPALLGVGLLTALAFALRVRGIAEGLYHDEIYTYTETHGHSFTGMLHAVVHGAAPGLPLERTPPLYFTLAWLGSKLGSPETTIRLPSILLGTATVPLVYLLGKRTVGRAAALLAAAFTALSPFLIFYSVEARAYATLTFLAVLSALALINAVERRSRGWWAAYAVVTAAMLYTHYTAVFVIAVEALWALWRHRDQLVSLALAYLGALVLFAPWLPHYQSTPVAYDKLAAVVGIHEWSAFLQWADGSPQELPHTFPGTFALILLGVAAGIGLAGAILARATPWRDPAVSLVGALAVGVPVAVLVYGLFGDELFVYPRNMLAALPFAALALAWLISRAPAPAAAVAAVLAIVALGIGAAKTLEDRFHRPDSPGVAHALDAREQPGDPVVYVGPGLDPLIIRDLLKPYLREDHRVIGADQTEPSLRAALDRAGPRPVPVVQLDHGGPPPVALGWDQLQRRRFAGTQPLALWTFAPLRKSPYRSLSLAAGKADGAVDYAIQESDTLSLRGWSLTPASHPADHILAFVGKRLVAAGLSTLVRSDVAQAGGQRVGFLIVLPASLTKLERSRLRVLAVDGRVARPLPRFCSPQVKLLLGC
jgi:4-amino-4-deoxy-L-arabinose transferase-like glycosyltransferase